MICAKCKTENPDGMKFCNECGAALKAACAQCGFENVPAAKFCGNCGTALGSAARVSEKRDDTPAVRLSGAVNAAIQDGERKTVTALFADLKGSTELMAGLDPEAARAIVDPALKIMVEAVRRYDGYVVQSTGDGIFALFGAPLAHEDHPQRALYAALLTQDTLRRHSEKLAGEGKPVLQARVGVSSGEVVMRTVETGGRREYAPVGHAGNLASRMQTVAPVGGIVISEETRRLVEGYFELRSLGPTEIKGIARPLNIYEVVRAGPLRTHFEVSARRGLTKFVGREHEIDQMKRALELTLAGRGQIVAVVAEAGTGKSRLFYEFKATLPAGCKVLEAHSVSHGKASAWLPVLEMMRDYFGLANADDPSVRRDKVRAVLGALDPALSDALPYLFGLLGLVEGADPLAQMDPRIKRGRTLDAIKRIILAESINQPLVLIFEDLHWIDDQTQALLDLLADSLAGARILLLVDYRPQYQHGWAGKSHYTQLRLDPLRGESAATMLTALLGEGAELEALKRLVAERSGGNPFFIEELAQALFDEGVLVRNGTIKIARPLSQMRIPQTAQAVVAGRIDRLPAEEKALLQTLAVMGREFPLGLVRRIAGSSDGELERMLSDLQTSEFIYQQPAAGDSAYSFKHALTQEVAYNSLLSEQRKVLHERAAQGLEVLFGDSIEDHLTDVAFHYKRSGNDAKAVSYLIRAGEQALQRSAFSLAAAHFEDAFARLKNLPPGAERDHKEIVIHTGLADVVMVTSGYAAAEYERHLLRRHELAERLGDAQQLFYALVGSSVLSAFRLELNKAREIGTRLVSLADQAADPEMQLEAYGSLANVLWLMGDFLGSRKYAEKGVALFSLDEHLPSGKEHMRAACLFFAALCTAALGFPDTGLRQALEFVKWAEERAQALSLVFALNCAATVSGWRKEGAEGLKYTEALLVLTAEHGFGNWHSFGQCARGQALAILGRTDEAVAETRAGLAAFEATGAALPGWLYSTLAFAYLTAGKPAEGLSVVSKALEVADQTEDAEARPELHLLQGGLLLMADPTAAAAAEASFRVSIEVARRQHAKLSELRATMSLARLLASQGRRDEARTMLAEIHGWFTEGFGITDLKDARALLDELTGTRG